ncbi:OmpA family protein [Altericista sp. CCNU0014]|uniref:OmpA family protein n=1 Tax=Altericista sp. CCNU0014 TaxID=3082949 RepID=UPI0038506979
MMNDVNLVEFPKCEHHCNLALLDKVNIRHSSQKGAAKPTVLVLISLLSAFGLAIAGAGYLLGNLLGTKPNAARIPSLSNQLSTADSTLKILGDTFSGYSTFRTPTFQNALKASGLNLQYADEFDQAKRAASLERGQADLLVTTLDQFLMQKPAGKVVGLIDRTIGADAVVLNTKQFPQLKSLLDLTQMVQQSQVKPKAMAFAGDTPSEYLGLVLDTKFEAFNLADFKVVEVADASEAWKRMQDSRENVAIAILWEPYVTQARQQGGTVVLSSQDTPNTIVDVIVASDRLIQSRPEKVAQFLTLYYRRIDSTAQDNAQLKKDIAEDGQLSPADAATVLKGINFFTSLETHRWLTDGTFEKRIGSTAAILTMAGKLDRVPDRPKNLFSDRFIKGAIANTQKLIDLIRASDPQMAARLAGTQAATVLGNQPSKTQIQSAPAIGNLDLKGQVSFEAESAQLTRDGQQTLDRLRKEIAEFNPQTVAVRIIGHTSRTGDAGQNETLSQLRAQAVADYLYSLGLKHKIMAQGKGFREPLAGVSPEDNQNQRTEIRLVRLR